MPKKYSRKNKIRRFKRGGQEPDIEMGKSEHINPMSSVPPDPDRFREQQERMIRASYKPLSSEQVAAVFAGPTPEERERMNTQRMMDEDPQYTNPYARSDFSMFGNTGGRRSKHRTSRRTRKRNASRRRR
jgi:hypothetical protein